MAQRNRYCGCRPLARSAGDLKLAFETIQGLRNIDASAFQNHLPQDTRKELKDFTIGLKLDDAESPVETAYLDALEGFAKTGPRGRKIVRDRQPEVSNRAFQLYLSLLGAAMSASALLEDVNKLREAVTAVGNKRVSEVCGTLR